MSVRVYGEGRGRDVHVGTTGSVPTLEKRQPPYVSYHL